LKMSSPIAHLPSIPVNIDTDYPWCVKQAPEHFISLKRKSYLWVLEELMKDDETPREVREALQKYPTLDCKTPFTEIDVPIPDKWLLSTTNKDTFNSFIINFGNTNTGIHVEELCGAGLIQLLRGEKHWQLWKPGKCPSDYPRDPDVSFHMQVGDMLHVPSGWWHSVQTVCGGLLAGNSFQSHHGAKAFSKCLLGIKGFHEDEKSFSNEIENLHKTLDIPIPKQVDNIQSSSTRSKRFVSNLRGYLVRVKGDNNTRRNKAGFIRTGNRRRLCSRKNKRKQ
jgi:hypothetical protein